MTTNITHDSNDRTSLTPARDPFSFCRKVADQIEQASAAILSEFREELGVHKNLLRLAVNEAAALAWQTGYPQLVFPTLLAEKAQALVKWNVHQRAIQK